MKVALVTGAAGFIGNHMVSFLKKRGYYVKGVDLKHPTYAETEADEFILGDLRDSTFSDALFESPVEEVYQFAADMGGAGFVFTKSNDANIMHNSLLISLNTLKSLSNRGKHQTKLFYPSSACVYPTLGPDDSNYPNYTEGMAYPANPESEYGWEKIFSERLHFSFMRNYGVDVKIGRFHTIYGPTCAFDGGREKAPAALARKVILADNPGEIEIWGNGEQTRSFLYIEDCLDAVYKLVQSDFNGPVNIGSTELISINTLAKKYIALSGKKIRIKHIEGPIGIDARNSDNQLIEEKLRWTPFTPLDVGIEKTYRWIEQQIVCSH
jgi:nucleoside-diphosphate-sugar epimerase